MDSGDKRRKQGLHLNNYPYQQNPLVGPISHLCSYDCIIQGMVDKGELIHEVSNNLYRGRGAFFLGSGFSREAGVPGWAELLGDKARALGFDPARVTDWPSIAQFLVNENGGNRGPLVHYICEHLEKRYGPSAYHKALQLTNVDQIWTTNWDLEIERSFKDIEIEADARRTDSEAAHPNREGTVLVMKMHGCVSLPSSLVLTRSDYEDYFLDHRATAGRLELALRMNSFLFIGYSLEDVDFTNALIQARRLSSTLSLQHYIVLRRKSGEAALWQQHWRNDLKRLGIKTCFIEQYTELRSILSEIARRSRGPTVFITGSHTRTSDVAVQLGKALARDGKCVLMDGQQSSGIGYQARMAFVEEAARDRIEIEDRIRLYANPYASSRELENDPALLPILRQWRKPLLRATRVVVAFDGAMGTKEEVALARKLGCVVIPVPEEADGFSCQLLSEPEIAALLREKAPDYLVEAESGSPTATQVMRCIEAVMDG